MPEIDNGLATKREDEERVLQAAYELFSESPAPDWVRFFREILGLNGLVRRTFRTPEELAEFEQTETYAEILHLLTRLRERTVPPEDPKEPTRVITVRLPKSLHEALRVEAHEHQTSMNKLCISKLLQFIDNELIPKERWRRSAESRRERPQSEEAESAELGVASPEGFAEEKAAGADL